MDTDRTFRRRLRRVLAATAAVLAVTSLAAGHADATNALESASPAPDSELTEAPTQLQLVFRDALGAGVTAEAVRVAMTCDGTPVAIGPRELAADGRTFTAPLTQIAPAGTCNVSWALPDASSGTYSFKLLETTTPSGSEAPSGSDAVATSVAPTPDTSTSADEDSSDEEGGGFGVAIARWVAYVGLAALAGGLLVISLAWPEGVEYVLTLRFLRLAWVLSLVGVLANVILAAAHVGDRPITGALNPGTWADLFDTAPGAALIVRLALVVGSGWVALRPERVIDPHSQMVSLAVPFLAVATIGVSRTDVELSILVSALGAVHVVAMAVWLGGLLLLGRVVLAGGGDEDLVHAVRGYQRLATPALLLTVLTGLLLAWRLDGADLLGGGHGRLVVLKVLVVGTMIVLAVMTKQFVARRLTQADHLDGRIAHRLRGAVRLEALCGLIALALSTWMVALTPANADQVSASPSAITKTLNDGDFEVVVEIDPADVGPNGVRITLRSPEQVANLTVDLVPEQAPGVPGWRIQPPLTEPGTAVLAPDAGLSLGAAGVWRIEVSGDGPAGRLPVLRSSFIVSDPTQPVGQTTTTVPSTTAPLATLAPVTAPPATG